MEKRTNLIWIIVLLLLCSVSTAAAGTVNAHGKALPTSGAATNVMYFGGVVQIDDAGTTLYNVRKLGTADATFCVLYVNGALIVNNTFSGDYCVLDYTPPFTPINVTIAVSDTGAWTHYYCSSCGFPVVNDNVTWIWRTQSLDDGVTWTNVSNAMADIISVTMNTTIATNMSINATSLYNGTQLLTFNATLSNGVVSWFFSTTDGVLETNVSTGDYNITVMAPGYENNITLNHNATSDLLVTMEPYASYALTYESPVLEFTTTNLSMRLNTSANVTNAYASLVWNGTLQNVTQTDYSGYSIFWSSVSIPEQPSTPLNVSFYWDYNVTIASINLTYQTPTYNQTVDQIGIDNCTTYTVRAYNITIYDESTDAVLNGSIDAYMEAWVGSTQSYRSFNLTWGDTNPYASYGLCIDPTYSNFTVSAQLVYTSDGYVSKTYYWTNTTLDNATDLLDLYLTPNSTTIEYTVTDQDDDEVADVYIYVQSYDIGTNSYTTTEIVKTGSDGRVVGEVILGNPYKFILYYNGNLVLETQEIYLTEVTKKFRIDLTTDYFDNYDKVLDVSCLISYTNSTRNFKYVWADATGQVSQACITVTRETINGITQINQTCASSASGTALANIGTVTDGKYTYTGLGIITLNGNDYVCGDSVSWSDDTTYKIYGAEGLFASIMIILTLVLFGAWNPIVSVFLAVIAVIMLVLLNLFHLSYSVLIALIIVGGIAIYRLKQA